MSVFEADLKKVVALSTLSHLGFIFMSVAIGSPTLAFFHLISHALFKSLLFVAVGEMIAVMAHMQDSRFISIGGLYTTHASSLMTFSLMNLLGLPFLRGFYSKDYILEAVNYSSNSSVCVIILYINVILTYIYTMKLIHRLYSPTSLYPFVLTKQPPLSPLPLLGLLSSFRVVVLV